LTVEDNELDDPEDFSAVGFRFGAGLDVGITPAIFFRGEILYGIRFASQFEKDLEDYVQYLSGSSSVNVETVRGHGPDVKIAIGFRIF
jgi:hypothetical protein